MKKILLTLPPLLFLAGSLPASEISPVVSGGIATVAATPGSKNFRAVVAQVTANSVTKWRLMHGAYDAEDRLLQAGGSVLWTDGTTKSPYTLLCFTTWSELKSALETDGIDTSRLTDPSATH